MPCYAQQRYSISRYGSSSWRLIISYTRSDYPGSVFNVYVYSIYSTSYTIYMRTGVTVNATIRAQGRFNNYYCNTYLDGAASDSIEVTTKEYRKWNSIEFCMNMLRFYQNWLILGKLANTRKVLINLLWAVRVRILLAVN